MVICSRCRSKPAKEGSKRCEPCIDYCREYAREHYKGYAARQEYHKKWRDENPEKWRAYGRKDYETHREARLIKNRNWHEKNPERSIEIAKKWHEENPEKAREAVHRYDSTHRKERAEKRREHYHNYPEKERKAYRKWVSVNPEKRKTIDHNRRARLRNAEGSFTHDELITLFDEQKGRCYYCGDLLFSRLDNTIHRDHKIPLVRDGTNYISNIAFTCGECNLKKHTKTEEEFIGIINERRRDSQ